MWRRTYLLLLLIRVFFALSPSYLHPDEVFQGPEIVAGSIFGYPSHRTWEWTSSQPIRSVFPLWLFYGLPMGLLKSVWNTDGTGSVEPKIIYYSLRLVMFILSFVLEDWAIYELVHSPRRRNQAVMLVASSYVTWTFQTHTFSNSIETLIVLWSIVLINRIDRIVEREHRTSFGSCFVLGFLLVLGVFNRITFPAFVLIPGMRLLPNIERRPFIILALGASVAFWTLIAISVDTAYYAGQPAASSFRALYACVRYHPVITPLNNIEYNSQTSNLAQHGLHPHYQHILVNLPQLLGPAAVLLFLSIPMCLGTSISTILRNSRLTSAVTGILILSLIPHQEPRFLLPCVPLLLTCLQLPSSRFFRGVFWLYWIIFNIVLSILMGVFHQGGIIPAQIAIPSLVTDSLKTTALHNAQVYWWKTYPPPTYLLGSNTDDYRFLTGRTITTTPLMGLNQSSLFTKLVSEFPVCQPTLGQKVMDQFSIQSEIFLVAPYSAWRIEDWRVKQNSWPEPAYTDFTIEFQQAPILKFMHLATFPNHINLDDMEFADDGVPETLERVFGRHGLGVWKVEGSCMAQSGDYEFKWIRKFH